MKFFFLNFTKYNFLMSFSLFYRFPLKVGVFGFLFLCIFTSDYQIFLGISRVREFS